MDLYIDFETVASKAADLKKVGVDNYTVDPNFAVLCMGWKLDDGPVLILCPSTLTLQWQVELQDKLGIPSAVWSSTRSWTSIPSRIRSSSR